MSDTATYFLQDGEIFEVDDLKGDAVHFQCCDCGLVHRIAFARELNGNLGVAMQRVVEETATVRLAREAPYLIRALLLACKGGKLDADAVKRVVREFPEPYFDLKAGTNK